MTRDRADEDDLSSLHIVFVLRDTLVNNSSDSFCRVTLRSTIKRLFIYCGVFTWMRSVRCEGSGLSSDSVVC